MIQIQSPSGLRERFLNRLHARVSRFARCDTSFVSAPEPRTIGCVARGRQLAAGNFLMAGHAVDTPAQTPWKIRAPHPGFALELHGFGWLDDLAAVGNREARQTSAAWVWSWIDRFGAGRGPGWTADLTGRRLLRWINHAQFLLRGQPEARTRIFYRLLAQQAHFVARRWHGTPHGLPRIEALTGLIHAGTVLRGLDALVAPAVQALAEECDSHIDAKGGVESRNPEELLEVFTLLTWAAAALSEAGNAVPDRHLNAIERIAPCLRALRHADGGLARFNGGERGGEGRLDHALAASGVRTTMPDGFSMGYARLSAGRTSVIIDAAAPPVGAASRHAHASTLAFELTSGRRPMIVNCGAGGDMGPDWRRAARTTQSHSTLCLDGLSSAYPADTQCPMAQEPLVAVPDLVPVEIVQTGSGTQFQGAHDGYLPAYGLVHVRTIELDHEGRGMAGEDMLLALEEEHRDRFGRIAESRKPGGVPFDIRFHLHPEVRAVADAKGRAVSIILKSGEVWVFRCTCENMRLEPSVYLEKNRSKPRATRQIVLSGQARTHATRVRWSLSKPQETATALRDLVQDHLPILQD